ncbi:MAG: hypothetical protein ACE5JX_11700 [Acidobacteriota bacterium]
MYVILQSTRTTVEIPDEQRARLLELAAERGEKGFSRLVQEALELYLRENQSRLERVAAARATLGSLSEKEAESLRQSVRVLREHWR